MEKRTTTALTWAPNPNNQRQQIAGALSCNYVVTHHDDGTAVLTIYIGSDALPARESNHTTPRGARQAATRHQNTHRKRVSSIATALQNLPEELRDVASRARWQHLEPDDDPRVAEVRQLLGIADFDDPVLDAWPITRHLFSRPDDGDASLLSAEPCEEEREDMSRSFWKQVLSTMTWHMIPITGDDKRRWERLAKDSENATDGPWFVTEEDLVGGWCVRTIDKPPSSGRGITIADFIREEDARLCAAARNLHMGFEAKPDVRAAETSDIAIADDGRLYLKSQSSRYGK